MTPLHIALALAQFAPSLLRFFGVGDKSISVAEKAVEAAITVTGAAGPHQALEMLRANAQRQQEFQMTVIKMEGELEAAYIADRDSARKRDATIRAAGQRNYRADSMFVLSVLVISALVYSVFVSNLDEYAKGIITLVLGRFLGYLDNIYNFEFGSTRSSKTKDETINKLSGE